MAGAISNRDFRLLSMRLLDIKLILHGCLLVSLFCRFYFCIYFLRGIASCLCGYVSFFVTSFTFFDSLNGMRQMTAFFMFLCTLRFVEQRRFFPFFLSIVCISLFHSQHIDYASFLLCVAFKDV